MMGGTFMDTQVITSDIVGLWVIINYKKDYRCKSESCLKNILDSIKKL